MRSTAFFAVAATVLAGALACASALPPASGRETEAGRALYADKCVGCHRLYRPDRVTAGKWPALLEKMAAKAKLTPEEEQAVLAYVLSAATSK